MLPTYSCSMGLIMKHINISEFGQICIYLKVYLLHDVKYLSETLANLAQLCIFIAGVVHLALQSWKCVYRMSRDI